jgi:hypothetical protein
MNKTIAAILSLFLATAAFAHAGHHHLFGVVKSVSGDTLVVHATSGSDAAVQLTNETAYQRGDAGAKRTDIVAGVRVVIDLSADGKRAEIVKLAR